MYYLTVIQIFNDETPTAKAIYEYSTYAEALTALYSTMFSSLSTSNISEVTCLILDSECLTKKYERWTR